MISGFEGKVSEGNMLDWLIIGGGIHGTYLSLYLTRWKGVKAGQVRVLDAHDEPLTLWNHYTANTGMAYLRSSHAHNLHFDPFSLVTFARTRDGLPLADFIEPYGRPAYALFQAHCQRLIERYQLRALRLKGRATGMKRLLDGWQVETTEGTVSARRVIVAIGLTEQAHWPEWARTLRAAGGRVDHLFDTTFQRKDVPASESVVVGGGITAVQSALALAANAPGQVTLLMRHTPRLHPFDADLGWITHQYLDGFHQETDYGRRRAMIKGARYRGSIPTDVAGEMAAAEQDGRLRVMIDTVEGASTTAHGSRLHLGSGDRLAANQVVLATGFDAQRPGGAWLDAVIDQYGLPTAADGYPIVDRGLCWAGGLQVSGPLAELEVGPVARNFAGVKLAAERIGATL